MKPLPRLGFALQAGAFAQAENAARLATKLRDQGLDATHVKGPNGLYRVRFGDFREREEARRKGEALKAAGIIEAYWIVAPEAPIVSLEDVSGLRRKLVETAQSYVGVPYLWGGSSDQGFDCSGLTMAVYQLNGLRLPRSSQAQFDLGKAVDISELLPGDLVFFALGRAGRISHVGLYVGQGAFIHSPSAGRAVCREALETRGLREHFVGAKRYF